MVLVDCGSAVGAGISGELSIGGLWRAAVDMAVSVASEQSVVGPHSRAVLSVAVPGIPWLHRGVLSMRCSGSTPGIAPTKYVHWSEQTMVPVGKPQKRS